MKLNAIKGFDLNEKNVVNLVKNYENIGFQATNLAKAVKVIKKMRKEKATIFLSFTSNMVSSGLREIFAQLVRDKMVDAIITSVGAVEEDVMKCKNPFLLGDFEVDDVELLKKGINRIGNIFVHDDRYEELEDVIMPFFSKMYKKQKKEGKLMTPSEMCYELGKVVNDKNSILYWAAKNDIPVFCPAPTDGALGLQFYFFRQKNKEFGIEVAGDMDRLIKIVLNSDKVGGIILGGGIAKHHLIAANVLRGGLDYAVYVTTAEEYDGSLSGAKPKEAKSWGKLKEYANSVCVYGDATIIFPLIAVSMKND